MNHKLYPAFIDEAMRLLPDIRSALLVFTQDGAAAADLDAPLRQIRSLHRESSMLELTEVQEVAADIEMELANLAQAGSSSSPETPRFILDLVAQLEATLLRISFEDEEFSLDIDGFINESFQHLQTQAGHEEDLLTLSPEPEPEPALEGFEIDNELLEIFAEEAESLLKGMEASLEKLAANPQDSDALWDIRRNAHTFKGAAGIVGFKLPSALAHRVEDLLDRIAETNSGSNERIFELLLTATDCLKALTSGENSPSLHENIASLYKNFDVLLASLNQPVADEAKSIIQAAPPPPEPKVHPVIQGSARENAPDARAAQPRSIVRVSLNRLDDLVRIVRDMIVSRSIFEQRLSDFERQIDELHNATRRLQATSSKLEIDFEASMLSSDHPSSIIGSSVQSQSSMLSRPTGFDDLEFDQYTEFHQSTRELSETTSDTFAINNALDVLRGNFETLFDQQRRLVEEMQERLMRIRMVEFGTLATRLQRTVRVTCEEEAKFAQVTIENENLEIDTQILDSLIEPLMHLLKNAVVHGIETPETRRLLGKPENGSITVRVESEDTHIVLTVSDDGRGITASALKEKAVATGIVSPERVAKLTESEVLDLIFLPGLTTAEKLNLSAGRGVGMSIVKESIESRNGSIAINSVPQKGTTFTVRVPLSLAVTNVLLVTIHRQTFAVPLKQIGHVFEIPKDGVASLNGEETIAVGGITYPFIRLEEYLGLPADAASDINRANALMIESAGRPVALGVGNIIKSEEVVIKSLGSSLENLRGILGGSILGNGELVLILDLPELLKKKIERKETPEAAPANDSEIRVMIVDDSPSVRHMTSKMIENAGWGVITAKDGADALEQLKSSKKMPSIILSDIEMPRMDGYELAASLKRSEEFKSIPVVVITSRTAEKHREKAFESGVDEYLTKPFDEAELVKTVKNLINKT